MSHDHQAWFRKADEDLLVIDNNLASPKVPWPQMCFHAQQLAERYLEGFLVFHGTLPPKTHDLERLLVLAAAHDQSILALRDDCARLTELGFRSRYPEWVEETGEREGRWAINAGSRVREAIRAGVPPSDAS